MNSLAHGQGSAVIRRFWRLERALPAVRVAIWRTFYGLLARLFSNVGVNLMNWGYLPNEDQAPIEVTVAHALEANPTRLYAITLSGIDLAGLDVLEVGSGRGGGAAWVAENLHPNSMCGVELSNQAVELARRLHTAESNLSFTRGNALELPLTAESVDVVLNVESCHHYPSMDGFLKEVHRVLRPGGWLALSDYRTIEEIAALDASLEGSGLLRLERVDITANVVRALDDDNELKESIAREQVPWPFRKIMRTFAGCHGTDVYTSLADRSWVYYRYLYQKPVQTAAETG